MSTSKEKASDTKSRDKKRARPQGVYVPRPVQQFKAENPGVKMSSLREIRNDPTFEYHDKTFDEVEVGDIVMGPCHGLEVYGDIMGLAKMTTDWKEKNQVKSFDSKWHPHIVIEKNVARQTLQTVSMTTLGSSEGQKLADMDKLDYAPSCKYLVPEEGRDFEDNHIAKGQPNFKIQYEGTEGRVRTVTGKLAPGWTFTFAFYVLGPNPKTGKFHYHGIKCTQESVQNLRNAIDANEPERINFIQENYHAFIANGLKHDQLEQLLSRTRKLSLDIPSTQDSTQTDAGKNTSGKRKGKKTSGHGHGNRSHRESYKE